MSFVGVFSVFVGLIIIILKCSGNKLLHLYVIISKLLKDLNRDIRIFAVNILGDVKYEDSRELLLNIVKNDKEKRLIFYVDENRVGFTKFYSIDKNNSNCVLGADIERSHRGRGYAKHMWKLMLQKCFIEYDLHRVSLTTAEYNSIAIHLYTSLGFKVEGRSVESLFRDGRFYDQLCMYMLRNDWKK